MRVSAGILTADLSRLAAELSILEGTGTWAHVDVMDGQFGPALTVGAPVARAAIGCGAKVDAHLMVEEPRRFLADFAGAEVITVHAEATRHLHRTLLELTELAPPVRGIALNPATPLSVLEPVLDLVDLVLLLAVNPGWRGERPASGTARRVAAVRAMAGALAPHVIVGVDGGVTLANAAEIASWGPDVVVSGSAVYDGSDPAGNLAKLYARLQEVAP
jgi:ribulose-phosphate 3-epimerase